MRIGLVASICIAIAAIAWIVLAPGRSIKVGGEAPAIARSAESVQRAAGDDEVSGQQPKHHQRASSTNDHHRWGATPQEGDVVSEFGDRVKFKNVARHCDVAPDGKWNCDYIPEAVHPYADLSIGQLRQIAWDDGDAAILLAFRLGDVDFEQAYTYAERAFLLTGDPHAFFMMKNYAGVFVGEILTDEGLDVEAASEAYLWERLGYELKAVTESELQWPAEILSRHGYGDRIEALDIEAAAMAEDWQRKRQEVIGKGF